MLFDAQVHDGYEGCYDALHPMHAISQVLVKSFSSIAELACTHGKQERHDCACCLHKCLQAYMACKTNGRLFVSHTASLCYLLGMQASCSCVHVSRDCSPSTVCLVLVVRALDKLSD